LPTAESSLLPASEVGASLLLAAEGEAGLSTAIATEGHAGFRGESSCRLEARSTAFLNFFDWCDVAILQFKVQGSRFRLPNLLLYTSYKGIRQNIHSQGQLLSVITLSLQLIFKV
jgi:hypothetical protein